MRYHIGHSVRAGSDILMQIVTRVANLPNLVPNMLKAQYVLNSAHHGLAMNADGTKLCAAGTMDRYAAIVNRASFAYKTIPVGDTPYWATNGPGATQCWMSVAGDDKVDHTQIASRISYLSPRQSTHGDQQESRTHSAELP